MIASSSPITRAGLSVAEIAQSGIPAAASVLRAGGVLGGVVGLIAGGYTCLDLYERGLLDAGRAAGVLGRDILTGIASGLAASGASISVSAAGATVGAVISAPAWVPAAAAIAAAAGAGYLASRVVQEAWDGVAG